MKILGIRENNGMMQGRTYDINHNDYCYALTPNDPYICLRCHVNAADSMDRYFLMKDFLQKNILVSVSSNEEDKSLDQELANVIKRLIKLTAFS